MPDDTKLRKPAPFTLETRDEEAPEPGSLEAERWEEGEDDEPVETIWAVFGSVVRRGGWQPPARLRVLSSFGSVNLDYRNADVAFEQNDLYAVAALGSIRITVPPDLDVELDSNAFLGSISHDRRVHPVKRFMRGWIGGNPGPVPEESAAPRPLLRIRAFAFMGSVEIHVK